MYCSILSLMRDPRYPVLLIPGGGTSVNGAVEDAGAISAAGRRGAIAVAEPLAVVRGHLTRAEYDYVAALPAAKASDDSLQMFLRLCPYFRGEHHVEDIMWLENVGREAVMSTLHAFHDVIVRFVL